MIRYLLLHRVTLATDLLSHTRALLVYNTRDVRYASICSATACYTCDKFIQLLMLRLCITPATSATLRYVLLQRVTLATDLLSHTHALLVCASI